MGNKFSLRFKIGVTLLLLIAAGVVWGISQYGYPTGQGLTNLSTVQAKQADAFVGSLGINSNGVLDYSHLVNIDDTTMNTVWLPLMHKLGVRNYRSDLNSMGTGSGSYVRFANILNNLSNPTDGSQPISFDFGISAGTDSSSPSNSCFLVKINILIQGGSTGNCGGVPNTTVNAHVKINSFENPNEPDHCASFKTECQVSGETWFDRINTLKPSWMTDVTNTASKGFSVLQGNTLTKNIPILTFSPVHAANYTTAAVEDWSSTYNTWIPEKDSSGNIITKTLPSSVAALGPTAVQYAMIANAHQYCTINAESSCVPTGTNATKSLFSPLPLEMTEFGWTTANVSQKVQAKYITRGFFTNSDSGVNKSYVFTIRDRLEQSTDREKYFGIVQSDGTPKLAYTWLKNTIGILSDPGSSFTPGALTYSLTGSSLTNVHQDVYQKRDGSYYLVLFNDVKSSTDTDNSVSASLAFGQNMDVSTFDPSVGTTAVSNNSNVTSVNLTIPDRVIIVRVTPTTTTTTSPASALVLSSIPSSVTAGSPFAFTVTAKDSSGNVTTGYTGSVHFSSTDTAATLPSNYTFVASDNGVHTFNATLQTTGNQTLTVTDTANTALTVTSSTINVTTTNTVVTLPTMHIGDLSISKAVQKNGAWKATVTAKVVDQNGKAVSNATVTFIATATGTGFSSNTTLSCITGTSGTCYATINASKVNHITTVSFKVSKVSQPSYTYDATQNTDPDGDSDGTTITITN